MLFYHRLLHKARLVIFLGVGQIFFPVVLSHDVSFWLVISSLFCKSFYISSDFVFNAFRKKTIRSYFAENCLADLPSEKENQDSANNDYYGCYNKYCHLSLFHFFQSIILFLTFAFIHIIPPLTTILQTPGSFS